MIPVFRNRADLEIKARQCAGDGTVLCGPKLAVDKEDFSVSPWLISDGFWESWITLPMLRHVRPGMFCVDIGANVGYFTAVMLECGAQRVLAIEPNPNVVKYLYNSRFLNDSWKDRLEIYAGAVGESKSQATLVIQKGIEKYTGKINTGGAVLVANEYNRHYPTAYQIGVDVDTLDSLLSDWPRVDFIKIDIEGYEQKAWRGMQKVLDRNPAIMLEVAPGRPYDLRQFLQEIQERYPLRFVDYNGHIAPTDVQEVMKCPMGGYVTLWLRK